MPSCASSSALSELGIRLALGAPPRALLLGVLRHSAGLFLAGAALGAAGAWTLARLLQILVPAFFVGGRTMLAHRNLASPDRRTLAVARTETFPR